MKSAYSIFLERLIYSIDCVSWEKERAVNMTKLLASLDDKFPKWNDEMSKYQKTVEKAIDSFEKGEISDSELITKLAEIKKEIR